MNEIAMEREKGKRERKNVCEDKECPFSFLFFSLSNLPNKRRTSYLEINCAFSPRKIAKKTNKNAHR